MFNTLQQWSRRKRAPLSPPKGRLVYAMERQEELLAALALEYGKAVVSATSSHTRSAAALLPVGLQAAGGWPMANCLLACQCCCPQAPHFSGCLSPRPPLPPLLPQPAAQVGPDLASLLPQRGQLGRLPLLMAALGDAVKADRAAAWPVCRAFRQLYVPNKVGRCSIGGGRRCCVVRS